jgi:hypothetical protein
MAREASFPSAEAPLTSAFIATLQRRLFLPYAVDCSDFDFFDKKRTNGCKMEF